MEPVIGPAIVRCRKQTCALKVTREAVTITPVSHEGPAVKCFCCHDKITEISLHREEVVGAESAAGLLAFRIHFAVPVKMKSPTQHTEYRLRTTDIIDGGRGNALVQDIRNWALNERDAPERRILLLVNPKSGKGKAQSIFQNKIRPFIRNVLGWKLEKITTEHKGHATEIIRGADLNSYTMIGFIGGDGTIHEALQGLLNRTDWNQHVGIPLVPFPVGTGNALARSIGITSIDTALVALSKERRQKLDILSIVQNETKIFSFLGVMHGALSSIDIESEGLRCCGDFRFAIGALRELFRMQSFKVKIAYLPYMEGPTAVSPFGGMQGTVSGVREPPVMSPSTSTGGHDTQQDTSPDRRGSETLTSGVLGDEVLDWFSKSRGDDFGPGNWIMRCNYDTRLMAALNLPFIAEKTHFMPQAGLSDGALHLITTPTELCTRSQMLQLLLKSEKGQHLGLHGVHYRKIKGLIFSPEQNPSILTVDGEVVASDLISVEVLPRLMTVISVPPPPQHIQAHTP